MFYCAHFGISDLQGGTTAGIGYQVTICFDDGLIGKINTLKLDSETGMRRFECHINQNTGM